MRILKEWSCRAHGEFESPSDAAGGTPRCPHGCGASMVERVFLTPPAIQSKSFRGINRTFETLAREHGLTNMRNSSGEGMRRAAPGTHARLNREAEMIIGRSRAAGLQGTDAGHFFKPLSHFGAVGAAAVSSVSKTTTFTETDNAGRTRTYGAGDTVAGPVTMTSPKPILDAPAYDGRKLGVPSSDR